VTCSAVSCEVCVGNVGDKFTPNSSRFPASLSTSCSSRCLFFTMHCIRVSDRWNCQTPLFTKPQGGIFKTVARQNSGDALAPNVSLLWRSRMTATTLTTSWPTFEAYLIGIDLHRDFLASGDNRKHSKSIELRLRDLQSRKRHQRCPNLTPTPAVPWLSTKMKIPSPTLRMRFPPLPLPPIMRPRTQESGTSGNRPWIRNWTSAM
jgi:hypothetical protein